MYKVSITAENYFVQVKPSILGDVAKFTSIRQTCNTVDAVVTGCEISVYFYYEDVLNNTGYDTIIISSGDSGQLSPTGYTLTTLYGVSAYYTYTTCPGYQNSIGLCPGIFPTSTTTTTTSTTTTTTTVPGTFLPLPLVKYDQYSSSLTAGSGGKWTNLGTTGSYADLISSGSITSGGTGTGTYLILNQGSTVNQCLFTSASRGINLGQVPNNPYSISVVVRFTNLTKSTSQQTIMASITGSGTGTKEDSYYLSISGMQVYNSRSVYPAKTGSYSVISWIPGVNGSQGFGPVYYPILQDKWYHFISTFDGNSTSYLYINGLPAIDPETNTPWQYLNRIANTQKSRLVIGNAFVSGSMNTGNESFSGYIGAIAIYTGSNANFTPAQVDILHREYSSRFTLG